MAYRNREEEKLERREEQSRRESGQEPGEKPKRTWKERDAKKDGAHSSKRDDGPRPKGESAAYRAYKSKLGRLFDEGKGLPSATVVETVRGEAKAPLLPKVEEEAAPALAPKDRLKAAASTEQVTDAAQACIAAGGLPMDTESLLKVLLLNDQTLVGAALEALLDAMEKGRPKNAKAIVARLAELTLADPHAADIAKGIRTRLGG